MCCDAGESPSLPLYKHLSVPVYAHPTPSELLEIRQRLVSEYGSVKKAKTVLRSMFRCYLSENSIWRVRVYRVSVNGYAEPPSHPTPSLINVMTRTMVRAQDVIEELRRLGVALNPYSSPSVNENACVGFYSKSFDQMERVVDSLGRKGMIKDAMILNVVWYLNLGGMVNLQALVDTGVFAFTTSRFKYVTGTIDDSKVAVFNTGNVRILRAPVPDVAKKVAGKVYYLVLESGALIRR